MKAESETKPECCPKFDPIPWDDRFFEWDSKMFIKDSICTFFFMPLNFGKVMKRMDRKVSDAGGKITDWLCLSDHTSKWNMDVYLAVDRNIQNAENVSLTGKFYSKVYEGPFSDTGKWCKDYTNIVKAKGLNIRKMYMWYTTCPKCSKKYGKNYVAIVSQVD